MPWKCCGTEHLDSLPSCPACGKAKQKWTTHFARTRVFRVPTYVWIELLILHEDETPCAGEAFRLWLPGGDLVEGVLDAGGAYRAPRLPVAREDKHRPCKLELPGLDAVDFVSFDDVARPADDAWVAFRVEDERGVPAAGEPFRLELADGEVVEGSLDEHGAAYVEGIPPGACRLSLPALEHGDVLVGVVDATPPPAPAPAWLAFALRDGRGDPVAGARWRATLADGSQREGALDAVGAALLDGVPPGAARLEFPDIDAADWLAGPGFTVAVQDEALAAPAPPVWVAAQLVDDRGEPVAGLAWKVTLADGAVREGTLDAVGQLVLEGIPAGPCRLELPDVDEADWRAGPGLRAVAPADVAGAPPPAEDWLAAQVLDLHGAPARGAWRATLADGTTREGALDDQGQLVLEHVPAGVCRLEFPDIDGADFASEGG